MSEKKRKKKDGEDKNKNNQRQREVTGNAGKKTEASERLENPIRGHGNR